MKACADCKFYGEDWGQFCDCPELQDDDPIYGKRNGYPSGLRAQNGKCGPEAKFFVPRKLLRKASKPIPLWEWSVVIASWSIVFWCAVSIIAQAKGLFS